MRSRFKVLLASKEHDLGQRITLEDVAAETGINVNTLSRWSQPKTMTILHGDVAHRLCQYFGVKLDDLIEFVPLKR